MLQGRHVPMVPPILPHAGIPQLPVLSQPSSLGQEPPHVPLLTASFSHQEHILLPKALQVIKPWIPCCHRNSVSPSPAKDKWITAQTHHAAAPSTGNTALIHLDGIGFPVFSSSQRDALPPALCSRLWNSRLLSFRFATLMLYHSRAQQKGSDGTNLTPSPPSADTKRKVDHREEDEGAGGFRMMHRQIWVGSASPCTGGCKR